MARGMTLLTAWAAAALLISRGSASPVSLSTPLLKRADLFPAQTCTADTINKQTWQDFGMNIFLTAWSAVNVTVEDTNNVQSMAASFGAPNFFCGLDQFCNAGQPCEPVAVPGWYALVAIQNWNSYMNSLNTAITFASTIVGLTLPSIVSDLYPKPADNITPLKNAVRLFTTVLGVVPFTGAVSTANSVFTGGINYVSSVINPPAAADLFVNWGDISASLATVVTDYQAAVSTGFQNVINAPVNGSGGINDIISNGDFFGVSQNVSQADLQKAVTSSIQTYSIGLVFQAQKIFLSRTQGTGACKNFTEWGNAAICINNSDGTFAQYIMTQSDSNRNSNPVTDQCDLLVSKYGMTQEQILLGPAACKDANGGKQLTDPLDNALPLDSTTQCLFNVIVCDRKIGSDDGTIDDCRNQGLDV